MATDFVDLLRPGITLFREHCHENFNVALFHIKYARSLAHSQAVLVITAFEYNGITNGVTYFSNE